MDNTPEAIASNLVAVLEKNVLPVPWPVRKIVQINTILKEVGEFY